MNAAEQQIKDWHEAEMQQVFDEECRERMGRECCLHPEYQFDEKHRQVVGRE